jgi:hypothetical protein
VIANHPWTVLNNTSVFYYQVRLLDHAMITHKSIHGFFSIALIICSMAAFGVSLYFSYWMLLVWMLLAAIFIFAASFIMEWFHVSISDPILWLVARFETRRAKHKIER